MVEESVCKKCKWLHTSGDLALIAKLCTISYILERGDHNQQEKQSARKTISLYRTSYISSANSLMNWIFWPYADMPLCIYVTQHKLSTARIS